MMTDETAATGVNLQSDRSGVPSPEEQRAKLALLAGQSIAGGIRSVDSSGETTATRSDHRSDDGKVSHSMNGATAALEMTNGGRVVLGRADFYEPATGSIHLTRATAYGKDRFSVWRAIHEAGHLLEHRAATWLWFFRSCLWAFQLTYLACAAASMVMVFTGDEHWIWTAVIGVASWLSRSAVIVLAERRATHRAITWLSSTFDLTDDHKSEMRSYLRSLENTYWWTLVR